VTLTSTYFFFAFGITNTVLNGPQSY